MRLTTQTVEEQTGCPPWCRRDHHCLDQPEDQLHQSEPAFVAMVLGEPRFGPDEHPRADSVVLRLTQRRDSSTVWLEASSEEGRALHFVVSTESARRLTAAMAHLLLPL